MFCQARERGIIGPHRQLLAVHQSAEEEQKHADRPQQHELLHALDDREASSPMSPPSIRLNVRHTSKSGVVEHHEADACHSSPRSQPVHVEVARVGGGEQPATDDEEREPRKIKYNRDGRGEWPARGHQVNACQRYPHRSSGSELQTDRHDHFNDLRCDRVASRPCELTARSAGKQIPIMLRRRRAAFCVCRVSGMAVPANISDAP